MSVGIKRRRGTTAEHELFTGLEAELTVDLTKKTVVVHDGATAGGNPLATEANLAAGVSEAKTYTDDSLVPVTSQLAAIALGVADMQGKYQNEFLYGVKNIWDFDGISSGSTPIVVGTALHPGVLAHTSHASNANSGGRAYIYGGSILLAGGEKTTIIFKTAAKLTGVTRRMGFHDTLTHTAPSDGVYARIVDGVMDGCAANNTALTVTATNYTLSADTWYRLVISIAPGAASATFTLYADNSTTVLWTNTVSTNIPTAAGREVGHNDICTLLAPGSATVIGSLDYMDIVLPNARRVL